MEAATAPTAFLAPRRAQAMELSLAIAALLAGACPPVQAHWMSVVFSQGSPLRIRVERRYSEAV
jgi:hypothetical protein